MSADHIPDREQESLIRTSKPSYAAAVEASIREIDAFFAADDAAGRRCSYPFDRAQWKAIKAAISLTPETFNVGLFPEGK